MAEQRPIIIIKRKKGHGGGHHGGAWKVAYADFVTAMMAFFLVMWLVSTVSKEQRAAMFDEKRASLSPLRFYRWCGVVLIVAGAAGFTWQQLR